MRKWVKCGIKGILAAAIAITCYALAITGLARLVNWLIAEFGTDSFLFFMLVPMFVCAVIFFIGWFAQREEGSVEE